LNASAVATNLPLPAAGPFFLRIFFLGIAGWAQAASIAIPWNGRPLWWLQVVSLAVLVWQLDVVRGEIRPRRWLRGTLQGWLFATAWLCGTFWWLFISLHVYGGLAAPLAVLAVLALAAGLSLYYAAACGIFVACAPKQNRVGAALFFAALWTLAELLRGSWFTGFPWGAGGYAHLEGPFAGYAPWIGVYGIGAASAMVATLGALSVRSFVSGKSGSSPSAGGISSPHGSRRFPGMPVVWAFALLLAPIGLSAMRSAPDAPADSRGTVDVQLLQGNIPQDEKFVIGSGIDTALEWYGIQLRDATASLVITPETALPLLPSQLPEGYVDAIAARYASGDQAAIVGIPLEGEGGAAPVPSGPGQIDYGDYRNAVLGFKPGAGEPYRYEKHHLVPFGEFVPSMFRWFTNLMNIPLGDFHRGALAQAPFVWHGQRIATNICYEDLFGDEIGANFRDPARAPTILLNVSNIGWFGDSVAIDQHLAISRMRSLEFERPMVRATNTGATAVIDHRGRVVQKLPRLTRGVLAATVEGRGNFTPFALWVSRFGLWPLWGATLLVVALGVWAHRRSLAR
jgi:apolipoprotein N-acyltransferase